MSDGLHVVHIRIVDAVTGRPTPVRVRFQAQDGRHFAPLGRTTNFPIGENQEVGLHVRTGGQDFTYVDGSCEILLPADPFEIEIVKGPEYIPIKRTITLGPGKMALRFVLEASNLPARGWYAGDCRCHELSPHAALLEGAAEGLAVVNLLARQRASQFLEHPSSLTLLEAFSGQTPCLTSPESAVAVNTFNVHPKLGSLALLSCHRPVFPLQAGDLGFEDWTLSDWAGQCHRKRGLVLWSEPAFWSDSFQECLAPEGLAQLLAGDVDAVEIAGPLHQLGDHWWTNWYALLNAAYEIPLAGASAKTSNQQLLGQCRTYAYLGPDAEFSYSAWIEAVREGKTCISDGPFIDFEVDGNGPGATVMLLGPDQRLQVKATVQAIAGGGELELVGDGEVIACAAQGEALAASVSAEVEAKPFRWLAARYRLPGGSFAAHTSPVYLYNLSLGARAMTAPLRMMQKVIQRGALWAKSKAIFRQERHRKRLMSIFLQAAEEIDRRSPRIS